MVNGYLVVGEVFEFYFQVGALGPLGQTCNCDWLE